MGHYAKVVDNVVVDVIVADEEFFKYFVDTSPGEWIKTSYNSRGGVHYNEEGQPSGKPALRKNFAGKGFSYNRELDAFIPPKPYNSWTLNEQTCLWEPPIPLPTDNNKYVWNENEQKWDEVE